MSWIVALAGLCLVAIGADVEAINRPSPLQQCRQQQIHSFNRVPFLLPRGGGGDDDDDDDLGNNYKKKNEETIDDPSTQQRRAQALVHQANSIMYASLERCETAVKRFREMLKQSQSLNTTAFEGIQKVEFGIFCVGLHVQCLPPELSRLFRELDVQLRELQTMATQMTDILQQFTATCHKSLDTLQSHLDLTRLQQVELRALHRRRRRRQDGSESSSLQSKIRHWQNMTRTISNSIHMNQNSCQETWNHLVQQSKVVHQQALKVDSLLSQLRGEQQQINNDVMVAKAAPLPSSLSSSTSSSSSLPQETKLDSAQSLNEFYGNTPSSDDTIEVQISTYQFNTP